MGRHDIMDHKIMRLIYIAFHQICGLGKNLSRFIGLIVKYVNRASASRAEYGDNTEESAGSFAWDSI